jgi:hypothetical protein
MPRRCDGLDIAKPSFDEKDRCIEAEPWCKLYDAAMGVEGMATLALFPLSPGAYLPIPSLRRLDMGTAAAPCKLFGDMRGATPTAAGNGDASWCCNGQAVMIDGCFRVGTGMYPLSLLAFLWDSKGPELLGSVVFHLH